ncbi:GntR family transcriptional regulator [Kitasatospora sp. NPDC088391]|uniref:GntR family transcriptional regulator n=1 Tax=Kitasatospora sp. NPDC088391 TaxID=3364074 RepID=UPI00382D09D5
MNHGSPHRPVAPARSGVPEHGRVPKYFLVKARVEELLGELGPGGRLPTEADLAERYGVARATVRQALRDLLVEGRLRRQGRGTVVAGAKIEQPLSLASYTEGVTRQGLRPGRTLIALDRLPADPATAERLAVRPGEPLWHLERVLRADEERVGLESTYLPVTRLPHLERDFDPSGSLYAHLAEHGVHLAGAEERIETVLATPREALLIGTPPALPMLLLHRRSRDTAGHPLELVRTLYRGDRFSFTLALTAPPGP